MIEVGTCIEDCPVCRQPMRTSVSMTEDDLSCVVNEECSTCDHRETYEVEPEGKEENSCLS